MNNILPTLKYIKLTLLHKWFVFQAGRRLKVGWWRLIKHDWSKLTPAEAPHYGRQFFGDKSDPQGFQRAWLHHWHTNDHHWEHWVEVTSHDRAACETLLIPDQALREMAADWLGASRAYEGKWPTDVRTWTWFQQNVVTFQPDGVRERKKVALALGIVNTVNLLVILGEIGLGGFSQHERSTVA